MDAAGAEDTLKVGLDSNIRAQLQCPKEAAPQKQTRAWADSQRGWWGCSTTEEDEQEDEDSKWGRLRGSECTLQRGNPTRTRPPVLAAIGFAEERLQNWNWERLKQ